MARDCERSGGDEQAICEVICSRTSSAPVSYDFTSDDLLYHISFSTAIILGIGL